MASRPKDNSRKGDADKSATRKSPETKKSGASKAASSDVKGKTSAGTKSARGKNAAGTKKNATKKTSKDVRAFQEYLGDRLSQGQAVLSRDRTIIDHLVFAIFLENGSFDQARHAFLEIMHNFVDWNEVRVSKANEIASVIGDIPCAVVAGERLRRLLQWIFDKTYDFDLEGLRQKGESELFDFVSNIPYSTRFMNDYVRLFVFGDVNLPLNEGALRVLRLLGFVKVVEDEECLDDSGAKLNEAETVNFFIYLHELGVKLMSEAGSDEVLKLLKGFDKNVAKRSAEPLVPPKNYDPVDIARQLARKQKDDVRRDASPQMYDAPSDSELDDDSDDYEMDSDGVDDNQEVGETDLSGGETSYRAAEKNAGGSSSSRLARNKSEEPFKAGAAEKDIFVSRVSSSEESVASSKPPRKTKKSDASEGENASSKKATKARSAESQQNVAEPARKTARSDKQKKSEEVATSKTASKHVSQIVSKKSSGTKRRASDDTSNVAASEPPDSRRKGGEQAGKTLRSSVKSVAGKDSGDESGKSAKRAKSKDSAAKASKLKEIQQKKPR